MGYGRTFRYLYLSTWALFVGVTLALSWRDVRVYQLVVVAIGYVGSCFALAWALRDGEWVRASMLASFAVVLSYMLWWVLEISVRYSYDSTPGALRTVLAQFQIWTGMIGQRIDQSQYLGALLEFYWLIGMPLVQLVFGLIMVFPADRSATANIAR